jgi:hypothetical protein
MKDCPVKDALYCAIKFYSELLGGTYDPPDPITIVGCWKGIVKRLFPPP